MSLPVIEGMNAGHAAAGFGGALASLPFMPPGSRWTILLSLCAGLVTAMFLTPIIAEMIESPRVFGTHLSVKAELGLAFILGLTSMVLLPIFINVVRWFSGNLDALMRRFTGIGPPSGQQGSVGDKGPKEGS